MNNNYVSISDLTKYIKSLFDKDCHLNRVYIKGEISNFKAHSRGHYYFSLKDENSKINAIMFASATKNVLFNPQDGMNVLIEGRISVYEATGNYQIYVEQMCQDGIGNLYLEYEKLKNELHEKGYFNKENKKGIPAYPTKIGIITAPTGAAIKDILSTIGRRYPITETILFPCLVQGDDAKKSIADKIYLADKYNLDVLIVGRGGGSIEDLWAFNEREVAEAIFNAKTPIISAVGHEVDFTIADYVADLRAPTPTAAAELAVPNLIDIINLLNQYKIRLNEGIVNYLNQYKQRINNVINSFGFKNPLAVYEVKEQKLANLLDRLQNVINKKITINEHQMNIIFNKLQLLNPLNILSKGYSVVESDSQVIKKSSDLKLNDIIKIKFYEGEIKAKVEEVK